MADPIDKLVGDLPGSNLTTRALRILDYVVPGQWGNITDFNALIEDVTKVHDRKMIDKIHVKAMTRYLNRAEGYQTAMRLYQLVDKVDMVVAAAATASSVGRDIEWLSFLNRVTPDADTTQAIDAAIKLTAEIVAYFYLHDLPKTNLDAYVTALKSYKDAEIMRIAAFVVFDCLIPLGPDFLNRITEILHRVSSDDLGENKLFKAIKDYIPGDDADDKLGFVKRAFKSCSGWIDNFVEEKGINQAEVVGKLRKVIDFSDKGLDYVAAALDMSTNYFEHTGTQTVARVLIADAWEELGGASGGQGDADEAARVAAAAMAAAMNAIHTVDDDDDDGKKKKKKKKKKKDDDDDDEDSSEVSDNWDDDDW